MSTTNTAKTSNRPAPRVEIVIVVDEVGKLRFVHDDDLVGLLDEGEARIERASHVEPKGRDWFADLAPVGGPALGPFPTRRAALGAEHDWLLANHLGVCPAPRTYHDEHFRT